MEATYKLKDHLWYLSDHFVPLALFSARVADRDKKEKANASLKFQNQTRPDCQPMPETKDFEAKRLKHFIGPDSWTVYELLHGKEPIFLTKRVQKWSTEESYVSLKEVLLCPLERLVTAQRDIGGQVNAKR